MKKLPGRRYIMIAFYILLSRSPQSSVRLQIHRHIFATEIYRNITLWRTNRHNESGKFIQKRNTKKNGKKLKNTKVSQGNTEQGNKIHFLCQKFLDAHQTKVTNEIYMSFRSALPVCVCAVYSTVYRIAQVNLFYFHLQRLHSTVYTNSKRDRRYNTVPFRSFLSLVFTLAIWRDAKPNMLRYTYLYFVCKIWKPSIHFAGNGETKNKSKTPNSNEEKREKYKLRKSKSNMQIKSNQNNNNEK